MEKGLLHKQIRDFFVRNFDVRQEKEDEINAVIDEIYRRRKEAAVDK